MVQKVSAKLLS